MSTFMSVMNVLKTYPILWPFALAIIVAIGDKRFDRIETGLQWLITNQMAVMKDAGMYPTVPPPLFD